MTSAASVPRATSPASFSSLNSSSPTVAGTPRASTSIPRPAHAQLRALSPRSTSSRASPVGPAASTVAHTPSPRASLPTSERTLGDARARSAQHIQAFLDRSAQQRGRVLVGKKPRSSQYDYIKALSDSDRIELLDHLVEIVRGTAEGLTADNQSRFSELLKSVFQAMFRQHSPDQRLTHHSSRNWNLGLMAGATVFWPSVWASAL